MLNHFEFLHIALILDAEPVEVIDTKNLTAHSYATSLSSIEGSAIWYWLPTDQDSTSLPVSSIFGNPLISSFREQNVQILQLEFVQVMIVLAYLYLLQMLVMS